MPKLFNSSRNPVLISVSQYIFTYPFRHDNWSLSRLYCSNVQHDAHRYFRWVFPLRILHFNIGQFDPIVLVVSRPFLTQFYVVRYLERFSWVLLVAAIFMIGCQITLLYFWVKLKNKDIEREHHDLVN